MRHELDGDLDAILSDYAPDAVVATPEGIGSGYDHIRKNYERVFPLIGSLELTPSVQVQGEVFTSPSAPTATGKTSCWEPTHS